MFERLLNKQKLPKLLAMKRFLGWVFFGLVVGLLMGNWSPVKAQAKYTCDACGYCQNGEAPDNWQNCAQCLYGVADPNQTLNMEPLGDKAYTVFGCLQVGVSCDETIDPDCSTKAGAASFANFFLSFFTTIIGGLALLAMLFGGAKVMLARGDPDAIREGKRYVYGAILGLIVVASSVLIIKIIGGSLLQIPFLQ